MPHSTLVGAASRYIAGRNVVQTVYWKTKDSASDTKLVKFSKTFRMGKLNSPPEHIQASYVNFV